MAYRAGSSENTIQDLAIYTAHCASTGANIITGHTYTAHCISIVRITTQYIMAK